MIKTLAAANKSEREHFKIPRSVQQSIPIQRIYRDGIWMVNGKYSRTWRFADINYSVASHEDQQEMFLSYCGVLNSLPTGATAKITINNRRLNGTDFQHSVLMRLKGDGLDKYRQEYNGILMEKAVESNNLIQDKYITISVERKNIEEARTFFKRVDIDLGKSFGKLDSGAKALDNHERLRIFHDFFRPGEEQDFRIDLSEAMKRGHSFKDAIAPDGMQFKADHFEIGGKVGRVLFLREYASYIKVNYFWGGKSRAIGWDSRWGQLTKVWAAGSSTTGTYRPFGLDCSGFVDWTFNNSLGYIIGHGGGVIMQHRYCTDISQSAAQPGDLAFYPDDSHIGIIVGRNEAGKLLVCHCASGQNNVVITEFSVSGFTAVGRPDIFD